MNRTLLLAAAAALLVACSSKPADPSVVATPATRQPTVLDAQLETLDDAKKVQATVDEADRKHRKEIEDAGG